MVAFSSLHRRDTGLIRKSLDAAVLIAPISTALPTSLTSGAGGDLEPLTSDWLAVGWVDKGDGITAGRNVDAQETESLGSAYPTRRDISKVDSTVEFTMQETNRLALQLAYGVELDPEDFDATSKEVAVIEASRPDTIYYRCLVLWTDLAGTDAIFGGNLYPRVSVTDMSDVKYTDAGDPLQYQVTLTAYVDAAAGYAVKHLYGGPGWASRLTSMGWS